MQGVWLVCRGWGKCAGGVAGVLSAHVTVCNELNVHIYHFLPSSRVRHVLQSMGKNSTLFSFHCSGKYFIANSIHVSLKLKQEGVFKNIPSTMWHT